MEQRLREVLEPEEAAGSFKLFQSIYTNGFHQKNWKTGEVYTNKPKVYEFVSCLMAIDHTAPTGNYGENVDTLNTLLQSKPTMVVRLTYDPAQVSLRQLLEIFFLIHDPTQLNRQGHDVGTQYRSGIYFTTPEQQQVAQALIAELQTAQAFGQPIVTEVLPLANYWPAEDYHQDFFERNPSQGYCLAVAAPKVAKLRAAFADWLRD